jgi:hypothetical protein
MKTRTHVVDIAVAATRTCIEVDGVHEPRRGAEVKELPDLAVTKETTRVMVIAFPWHELEV